MKNLSALFLTSALLPVAVTAATPQQLSLNTDFPSMLLNNPVGTICPAGLPNSGGLNKAPLRNDEQIGEFTYIIVDEDFSEMTNGSQDEFLNDFIGVPGEPYIDDTLTKLPGWSTLYGEEADGAIAISSPIGGCLNTPLGDYSGKLIITFRMRCPAGHGTVGVMIARGGIWQPEILDMNAVSIDAEETPDPEGWHEFTIEFDNTYSSDDCFVQFSAYYCQVLLDDIKIITDLSDILSAPAAKTATDFRLDGFTANWAPVRSGEKYMLNVYRENIKGEAWTFNGDFEAGLPEGWTAEGDIAPSADSGADNSACLKVSGNAMLVSPLYKERLRSVEFWMRLVENRSYASSIRVEGFDGSNWVNMGQLYLDRIPTDEQGASLLINGEMNPAHHDAYYQLRFVFSGWDSDAEFDAFPVLVLDNINITSMPQTEAEYAVKDLPVEGDSYLCEGLDPESDYYYTVRVTRHDGKEAVSSPVMAFGISVPVVTEATAVTENTYTANWNYVPKATAYHVRDYGVFEAPEAITDYPVLYETFAPAAEFGGTIDEPLMGSNTNSYMLLDPYTENPGWYGASTLVAEGFVGAGGGRINRLQTPELTLNNGDGSFTVRVLVYSYADDGLLIQPSQAKAYYTGFETTEGWNEVTLDYAEGSAEETLSFSSANNMPFLLSEVEVNQSVNPGDRVYNFCQSAYVSSGKELSHQFNEVDFGTFKLHAYDVRAIYTKEYTECASIPGNRSDVSAPTAIHAARSLGKAIVNGAAGKAVIQLGEPSEAEIFDLAGRSVAKAALSAGRNTLPLSAGIYVIRISDKAYKVVIR